jgi:hypothetical protein
MSATDAKNHIGELWELAEREPVTIEHNGVPRYQLISTDRYVAVPVDEYARLKAARRTPRFGFARKLFKDFDTDALLAVDAGAELEAFL